MVKMVLQDTLEMMAPLESLDLRDHLVIKAVMRLTETAVDAHHILLLKVTKVLPVNQGIMVYLVILVHQVLVVSLVNAFLVILESLDEMVPQVMMEPMANLVNQANQEDLEILFILLRNLPVQIRLLT